MNVKHTIWIVAGLLGIAVIAGGLYVLFASKALQEPSGPATTFPGSGSISPASSTPGTGPSGATQTMPLKIQGGSTITVNDFLNNGVTIPDRVNPGSYLLAGNLGYCLSDPQLCQAAPADNFDVFYNSAVQSFNIVLAKEPIGQARRDMEQFLLATLGITPVEMCSLNYRVGVTVYVSEQYAGKNLGFSFCPGATVLPE